MTTEQIEKIVEYGRRYKMSWKLLASKLMQPPFHLTAVDATKVLDEYKLRFPHLTPEKFGKIIKPKPWKEVPQAALLAQSGVPVTPVTVTGQMNKGENIQTLAESNYKQSIINRSAVKSFALVVAKEKRAGKFERVSTQFVQGVEADVEALIREIGPADDRDIPCNVDFLNRKAIRPKVEEKLNDAIRKIIIRKVCSHPTMGKTLK